MSRGWDLGGARGYDASSWRLLCADPPGPGPGVVRPNVFCGLCPWDNTPPEINLGVANFSIEAWFSFKLQQNPIPDMLFRIGFMEPLANFLQPKGDIGLQGPTWEAAAQYDDVVGGAPPIETLVVAVPGGWAHLAVNFNRAGNMDFYVHGNLLGSVAINANNMGSDRFYALAGYGDTRAWYDDDWADWTTFSQCRGVVGPVAAHRRLLTTANIRESIRAKRVQNFGTGAGNSWLVWDWRLIERLDGGALSWDTDEERIIHAIRAGLQNRGLCVPEGAAGTIRIPDLSGSGNHWVLPTTAAYGTTTATKATIAFLSDPFWSS